MTDLILAKTSLTPQVQFLTTGSLHIKGISMPANTVNFFKPLFAWLNEFKETNPPKIELILELEYLNSTSTKAVVDLLVHLNNWKKAGQAVEIFWRFEKDDEDMEELGMDLQASSKTQLTFVGT